MRIIGIDLAITAAHKAVVLDTETRRYITRVLSFRSVWEEIEQLVARAAEQQAEQKGQRRSRSRR